MANTIAAHPEVASIPERLSTLALRFSGMEGIGVSFEFFPPRTEEMERTLWRSILRLAPLEPKFVSVTYGAGGSTRHRTHATVHRILKETSLTPAAHLTCVGASREEVDDVARSYHAAGVRHIVALRGDPPEAGARYEPHPGGYAHAVDLVAGLRRIADFDLSVAAYPETHPDAPSPGFDVDYLKRKLDAGASRAITQFFFDTELFLGFRDRVRRAGIEAPLIPGILPVTNYGQVARFARLCGTTVPSWLTRSSRRWRTTPRPASSWRRWWRESSAGSSPPRACPTSTSTPSTAPTSPSPSATCWDFAPPRPPRPAEPPRQRGLPSEMLRARSPNGMPARRPARGRSRRRTRNSRYNFKSS